VPYPYALDHDQAANAACSGGGRRGEVHPQATLSPERIAALVADAMDDPARMATMAAAASQSAGRRQRLLADLAEAIASKIPVAEFRKGMRMKMPQTIGLVHFIGIGGIGMSGIAEVLHNLGYKVQGSDQSESANVSVCAKRASPSSATRPRISAMPRSSSSRPRSRRQSGAHGRARKAAAGGAPRRDAGRADALPQRCVAIGGTHGKTTTTSMVATLLDAGGLDPTVINGGIINAYGTNARMGEGEWMVVEADESDGTFLKLPADVAVVTNIDPEHLDHFGTFDAKVRAAFRQFVENVPFYGFGVMCIDHPEVQALVGKHRGPPRHHLWREPAGRRAFHRITAWMGRLVFDVAIRDRKPARSMTIEGLRLPMPGRHNVSNATAAIAVAHELGMPDEAIRKAGCRPSAASSAASPRPASGTASRSSTTTATIRSRSRLC
jgi:UDP-N-acetylmuramate--alanine ligase